MCLSWPLILIKHLILNHGVWLDVVPKIDTKIICVENKSDYMLKHDHQLKLKSQHS